MTQSLLGQHWLREHPDRDDLPHVEAMQYRSIKAFQPIWDNRNFCNELLAVLPKDSYILARDHPLSEQHGDLWADPVGTGTRHANEWADKAKSGKYCLPVDRSFFLGINEPDATNGDRAALDRYETAFLDRLRAHGLRGGAFNFSTGHPRTLDGTPNTKADYTVFEGTHQAIVRGGHIGVLHIYGTGAVPCAPGHYDRLQSCPWQDVEWVVGEMGDDEHVIGGGPHIGYHGPFNGRLHEYCAWLDTLIMGINDPRIHSYQVFTYDFSHPWSSFDVRDIRKALETYDWQHTKRVPSKPATKPVTVHLPSVSVPEPVYPPFDPFSDENWFSEAKRGYIVFDNVNIRNGPGLDYDIVDTMQQGEPVEADVEVDRTGYNWVRVANDGWVADKFVKWEGAQPTPTGDNWQRAYPEVLKIEGGLSLDPNDTGNWYKGKLVGTKYGISAAVWGGQYDIPNLTEAQALEIYKRHYWDAAGCNEMAWPMCLIHFDTAIQHGVGVANALLHYEPTPEEQYLGQRALRYMNDPNWRRFGEAWGVRVDNLQDIAKESN